MICSSCGPMADGADDHFPDCPEAQRRRSGDGPRLVREMLETIRGFGKAWDARVAREQAEHQAAADPWAQLERAGVPLDALDSLRRYEATPASRAAEAFLRRGEKRTLLLIGPAGVGKSVAAARVVQLHLAGGGRRRAAWVPAESFTSMGAYDGGPERLKRAELLVVDDMGREARGFGRSLLSGVLRRRYEMGRRTVITTNADQGQLLQLYDPGMWDRLRGGEVVTCTGRSMRGG